MSVFFLKWIQIVKGHFFMSFTSIAGLVLKGTASGTVTAITSCCTTGK